jgi:SAM-dependent methyltransferase
MAHSDNINDHFFQGFYKEVWRKLIPAGLSEAEADFIEDISSLQAGQKVLDLMCGYGRHALPLSQRGFQTTAVDNLADYIDEIREKASQEQLPLTAVCSRVVDLELTETYDAAICMGNSFAFFNSSEAASILHNISAHLKAGGVFLINTWMLGEIAIKHFQEKEWFYAGEYKYLIDNQYLFYPSRIESEHIIIRKDGATESINGVDYIFTISELDAMLGEAGFSIDAIYATPRKKAFRLGDTRAYIVAKKQ